MITGDHPYDVENLDIDTPLDRRWVVFVGQPTREILGERLSSSSQIRRTRNPKVIRVMGYFGNEKLL